MKEIVTLQLQVEIEHQTQEGYDYIMQQLLDEVLINIEGSDITMKRYSMKSIDGSARVITQSAP